MFEIKKEISFLYQGKIQKFSAGSKISQQELIEKLNENNFLFYVKNGSFEKIIETQKVETENQPEEIIETQYRFEKSGYKQVDGLAFRKNSIYNESEIKDAGLDINTLLQEGAITWLK